MSHYYWAAKEVSPGCCGFKEVKHFGFGNELRNGGDRGEILVSSSRDRLDYYRDACEYVGVGDNYDHAARDLVNKVIEYTQRSIAVSSWVRTDMLGGTLPPQDYGLMRAFFIKYLGNSDTCYTPHLLEALMEVEGASRFTVPFVNTNSGNRLEGVFLKITPDTKLLKV